ncbi:MAG: TonB-dependent siderophore receptor [Gammaproteobacteria bacterium]
MGTPDALAQKGAQEIILLPGITVTGERWDETGYHVPNAATATKTETPLMETPVSIQIVPQQVLRDQQVIRFDEALENVSGVYRLGGDGIVEGFLLRGFQADAYYRDGVRVQFLDVGVRETANLERIEVLKGPAAVLYGRIEPGGLVNLVTKEPLPSPYYSLQQQMGSFDFYRTTVDATGPLTRDDTLAYRLNLAYQNAGSFREFVESDRVLVAPVLRLDLGDRTQASLYLEYQHENEFNDQGIPVIGNRPAPIPRERNLQEPGGRFTFDQVRAGFEGSHAFNERWTLRHRFDALFADVTASPDVVLLTGPEDPANCTQRSCFLVRDTFSGPKEDRTYYTTLDLSGKFETWGVDHTLLVGGDYWRHPRNFRLEVRSVPSIDIFNPMHVPIDFPSQPILGTVTVDNEEEWYGLYLQDQAQLPYHVHLLAGFRYDYATIRDRLSGTDTSQDDAITPRFGLVWRPLPPLSLYGNYVESFGRSNGRSVTGFLPPQGAQQWEIGVKTDLLDGHLTGSLAWFELTKQGLPVADPDPGRAAAGFVVPLGEARNRGLELDIAGEIGPGWKLIGSYAYSDSEITEDRQALFDEEGNVIGFTPGNQGHRFFGVPRFGGSLWTTYELQAGELRGLKLAGGIVARGQAEGDVANEFQIPGYAVVNLMAGYTWRRGPSQVSLQLNVDNLLDKEYFLPSAFGQRFVGVGAPRSFLGMIRVDF